MTDPSIASGKAAAQFAHFREEAIQRLDRDPAFRSQRIGDFVSFLRKAAEAYEFPWNQFKVRSDIKLCIQYTDQSLGNAMIKTVTDLLIENLMGENDIAILFRDEANPVSTLQSRATNKVLRVFKSAGGHFVAIKSEWLADFHAIAELRRRAVAGQLTYQNQAGQEEALSVDDVRSFMTAEFRSGLLDVLAQIIHLSQIHDEEDEAVDGGRPTPATQGVN